MNIQISEVANLPSRFGDFKVKAFKESCEDGCKEHLVIYKENLEETPIVRVHSECLTGDVFGSHKAHPPSPEAVAGQAEKRRGL